MDIHVFGCDSPYNKAFVEFMNRNFPRRGDAYVALWKKEAAAFPLPEQGNILYMPGGEFTKYKILYDLFEKGERIFAHSLFEPALSFFADYPGKKKFLYIPWGSEMAPFVFRTPYDRLDEPTRRFFYGPNRQLGTTTFAQVASEYENWRKMNLVTAKISHTLNMSSFEQQVLNHVFKRNIGFLPFQYCNPVDFKLYDEVLNGRLPDNPDYHFKKRFSRVIMLNHSGNPANNHISLIDALAGIERDDFGVVAPLSYGDPAAIKRIVKYGQEKLDDRFVPIREFLPPEQYAALMGQVDVFLLNTLFEGARANMYARLYLGGKVMVNAANIEVLAVFKNSGLDLPTIDLNDPSQGWVEEMLTDYTEAERARNREVVIASDSEAAAAKYYRQILEATEPTGHK